ncbi:MAG: lipoprotein-releasing ABC transporter permease subunit [Pseudomonadota bacterium]
MYRPLQFYIGLRYTRAKRRNHFISFISLISMLGIALGVTVLITVISVMNGFEKELRERILGMLSHATITSIEGNMTQWRQAMADAGEHPSVIGAAPFIERETLIKGYRISGALVRGIDPALESDVSEVASNVIVGELADLKAGDFGIMLGVHLATALGVEPGDQLTVFAPQLRATPAGVLPQVKRFTVVGLFEVGMHEFDRGTALVHLDDAARLFRVSSGASGIRLRVKDMFRAWEVARDLQSDLSGIYYVRDWTQQHANLFRAVQMEKTVMFVILSLIVAVAAFNIISTLVMVVTDKQADIAILRTLGATPGTIMGVFVVLGSFIGVFGTVLGLIGGVALASNVETIVPALEELFRVQFMSSDIYYISDLPSDMQTRDVVKIGMLSLLLTILSTIYPAWRASRTQPAEALRYE